MSTGRGNGVPGSFQSHGFKSGEVEVSSRAVWDVVMTCLRSLPLKLSKKSEEWKCVVQGVSQDWPS